MSALSRFTVQRASRAVPRSAAAAARSSMSTSADEHKSLVTHEEGVHQTMKVSKTWRNKPLFRRQGDVRFKTGMEAANLLVREAKRRDDHEREYIDSVTSTLQCLSPVFDRNPKYAFAAKTLIEPERFLQFRVAWIDDMGVNRLNRGFRVQYSSTLGAYKGSLQFGGHVTSSVVKALGFDSIFSNALTGFNQGAACGGSDFSPDNKSEAELQRFCQSYMTELAKYIGPDQDIPWMGRGVGQQEMGFLYGQYKRINNRIGLGDGRLMLSGEFSNAPGFGVVHFADAMLKDKGSSLKGKRVLILGSGMVARSVAEKLLEYGAIPLTFSDASGHVYEPDGFTESKLSTIHKIKDERGALLGRYVIASTTAEFNHPESILDIPCDICIPCDSMNSIDADAVQVLANNGCEAVIEGGQGCVATSARKILKQRGLRYGPHTMTMTGPAIVHGLGSAASDEALRTEVGRIYQEVKRTANEFNARGNLYDGANIAGFLRVANEMVKHGAV